MKHLIIATAVLLVLSSCNEPPEVAETDPRIEKLTIDNSELTNKLIAKHSEIAEFKQYLSEVQDDLKSIQIKENDLSLLIGRENPESGKDQIRPAIKALGELLESNKKKMKQLRNTLSDHEDELAQYKTSLDIIEENFNQKVELVEELYSTLVDREIAITLLQKQQERLDELVCQLEQQANTAWFINGTTKELTESSIIDRKGGIFGIGGVKTLQSNLDTDAFVKVDISDTKEIVLDGQKAEIVSKHPDDSYTINTTGTEESIQILDHEKFWEQSKYLAVVVKK
jgi:hypothetical protein